MLITLHLAVTSALVGLIWVIQLVKYPGFRFVSPTNFHAYHRHHSHSIIVIVFPLMVCELGLAAWLAWESSGAWQQLVPLLLIIAIWLSTIFIQIPLHQILADEKDDSLVEKLIHTNWIRTLLWTAEANWLLYLAV